MKNIEWCSRGSRRLRTKRDYFVTTWAIFKIWFTDGKRLFTMWSVSLENHKPFWTCRLEWCKERQFRNMKWNEFFFKDEFRILKGYVSEDNMIHMFVEPHLLTPIKNLQNPVFQEACKIPGLTTDVSYMGRQRQEAS